MDPQVIAKIVLAALSMAVSWAVWVSVSVFKHTQEIALLKQEIKLMEEVKDVLVDIRADLNHGRAH